MMARKVDEDATVIDAYPQAFFELDDGFLHAGDSRTETEIKGFVRGSEPLGPGLANVRRRVEVAADADPGPNYQFLAVCRHGRASRNA
jgi:hypothetical protein